MPDGASTSPRKRRGVLCMGAYCNRGGQAEPFYQRLCDAFGEPGPAWAVRKPQRVKWEIANCLSMCGAGPNLVIHPVDELHHHLTTTALETIIAQELSAAEPTSPEGKGP